MTVEQLALDLWAPARQSFVDRHQVGQIRLPWDCAAGPEPGTPAPRAGDLIPAWRCCHCGGVEVNQYHLEREHNCCGARLWLPYCHDRDTRGPDPYRMDAHWIPLAVAS